MKSRLKSAFLPHLSAPFQARAIFDQKEVRAKQPLAYDFKVLMLEDYSHDARQIAGVIYDAWGTRVELIHMNRVRKALKYLEKKAVDIVLLDLVFPMCQGIRTFKAVKEYAGLAPVIVFSGLPMLRQDYHFVKDNAFDFFLKGAVDRETFVSAVQRALDQKNQSQYKNAEGWG